MTLVSITELSKELSKKSTELSKEFEKTVYTGIVTKIIYSQPNYSVAIFEELNNLSNIKIVCQYKLYENEEITINGKWELNNKHGHQFASHSMIRERNLDKNGLIKYLKNNPDIVGIGAVKASQIVEKFGDNFDDIINNSPESITKELSIPMPIVSNLCRVWKEQSDVNDIVVNLSKYALTQSQILALIEMYGQSATEIVRNDPYCLCKYFKGISFTVADNIAITDGIDLNDDRRILAAAEYITDVIIGREGHCWIEWNKLLQKMENLLKIDLYLIQCYMTEKLDKSSIITYEYDNTVRCSNFSVFNAEEFVINYIFENSYKNPSYQYDTQTDKFCLDSLNEDQQLAVKNSFLYNFSVINGKAGTGKTFVISNIIQAFTSIGLVVGCAAPTGKAARRMETMTGFHASTIHRLLNYNSKSYGYNIDNKLQDYDVIIIDEFSMVDIKLAYALFSSLSDNTKVIIVGDYNQLPPIGVGNIFYDIITFNEYTKDKIKITELKEIVRQAGNLKKNSVDILNGTMSEIETDDWKITFNDYFSEAKTIATVIADRMKDCKKYIGYDSNDIQIIVPMKNGYSGMFVLNKIIQHTIQLYKYGVDIPVSENQYEQIFYLHDRVIQTTNDYNIDVMNGTLGNIKYISDDGDITIAFEDNKTIEYEKNDERLKNVMLAYVLTIHKTQGSEFPCVIVAIHSSQQIMLNKNLLYTAVTRSKEKVIVIGDRKSKKLSLSRNNISQKNSNFDYLVHILDN